MMWAAEPWVLRMVWGAGRSLGLASTPQARYIARVQLTNAASYLVMGQRLINRRGG